MSADAEAFAALLKLDAPMDTIRPEVKPVKKLWQVTASVEVELFVLAETREQAEKLGFDHWHQEWLNSGDAPESMHVTELRDAERVHPDELNTLPWGFDEEGARTVGEILAATSAQGPVTMPSLPGAIGELRASGHIAPDDDEPSRGDVVIVTKGDDHE